MSRPIDQALSNLIPRHNGPLPQELVDLASSLLAQSRVKASTLKPDEEIGRTLKTSLNLPKIEPRPPCAPRIYARLYNHFETLLATSSRGSTNTPRSKSKTATTSTPQSRKRPIPTTPSKAITATGEEDEEADASPTIKRRSRTQHNTVPLILSTTSSSWRTPRAGLKYKTAAEKSAAVPRWITPCVRVLCRKLRTRTAIPHVLAGVETVLTLPCPGAGGGEEDDDGGGNTSPTTVKVRKQKNMKGKGKEKDKLPALIAAIWFFVTTRLRGTATDGKAYVRERKAVLDVLGQQVRNDEWVLERLGKDKDRGEAENEEKNWLGWETVGPKDVDDWLLEINSSGWLMLDWFTNIVEGSGGEDLDGGEIEGEEEEEDDVDVDDNDDNVKTDVMNGTGAGLGTMINDRIHCLTDAKRREYALWKEKIMARIVEIENEQKRSGTSSGGMDTSEG
ncbi:hypothetical protein B7463_g10144, partial [Scytalidium lignicola]